VRAERLQEPGESLEAPELAGMSALGLEQLFVQAVSNGKQEAPRHAAGHEGSGLAGPDELA